MKRGNTRDKWVKKTPFNLTDTEVSILRALALRKEVAQYDLPKIAGKSYRTIIRVLQNLESLGLVKVVRFEPASKHGKEKKIYSLTKDGLLQVLIDFELSPSEFKQAIFNYLKDERGKKILAAIYEELGDELAQKALRPLMAVFLSPEQNMDIAHFSVFLSMMLEKEEREKIIKCLERVTAENREIHDIVLRIKEAVAAMEKLGLI